MQSTACLWPLALFISIAVAAPVSTPGAIQRLEAPAGMRFHYDAASDVSLMVIAGQTRIALSVMLPFEPRATLTEILNAYEAAHLAPSVEATRIAGRRAAAVSARLQTDNWWVVVEGDDLNLFFQVEDAGDAKSNRDRVEQIVRSVQLAPRRFPPAVVGSYTTGSAYSGDVQSSIGVYSESGVTLGADGSIVSSGHTGITGEGVSGYSIGGGEDGWWQVRGDRILAFYPPSTFYNYRYQAFSNGLEIYPPQGETLLWPRN